MKRILAVSAVAMVAAMAMLGCEWSTHGDDVQGYNDTDYQWVNFSGSYQKYYTTGVLRYVDNGTGTEEAKAYDSYEDESKLSGDYVVSKATGKAVRILTVSQKGQRITIRDNAGGSFTGTISAPLSAMGKNITTNLIDGAVVEASFSASGKSGAGLNTTLTGTFQGWVMAGPAFSRRTITGTWIEEGGRTASIYGTDRIAATSSGGGE